MKEQAQFRHFKIDNHNVTTARCIFDNLDTIIIYYDYNNNQSSTTLYYDLKSHTFLYNILNVVTARQLELLRSKIEKNYY